MQFKKNVSQDGGKNYLKLKDGESVNVIFRGEIFDYLARYENGKYVPNDSGSFRFRINAIVKEGTVYVAKIFENGVGVYQQLADLHSEYDLTNTVCKLTRRGSGTDTTYSVLPMLKTPITPDVAKLLSTLKLHDLSVYNNNLDNKLGFDDSPMPDSDDAPF